MARKRDETQSPESAISIVGPGAVIFGAIDTPGTVRVEGRIEGGVAAGKAVVVSAGGSVEGDIQTEDAVISGAVRGSVTALSRIEITPTGRVEGDLYTRTFRTDEGAVLDGGVTMTSPDLPGTGTDFGGRPPEGPEM
jgi:cytoskeletal protein CcmA (bactofilin family)